MRAEQYIYEQLQLGGISEDAIHKLLSAADSVYCGMQYLKDIADQVGRPDEHPKYPLRYYIADSLSEKDKVLEGVGVCPICRGDKWVWDDRVCPGGGKQRKCPSCKGTGKCKKGEQHNMK